MIGGDSNSRSHAMTSSSSPSTAPVNNSLEMSVSFGKNHANKSMMMSSMFSSSSGGGESFAGNIEEEESKMSGYNALPYDPSLWTVEHTANEHAHFVAIAGAILEVRLRFFYYLRLYFEI